MKGIAIGVAPIALLGGIVGLALFYPDSDESADSRPIFGAYSSAPSPVPLGTPSPGFPAIPLLPATPTNPEPTAPLADSTPAATPSTPPRTPPSTSPARRRSSPPPTFRLVDQPLAGFSFRRVVNHLGPIERNSSNGEGEAGDGSTITIEGVRFGTGLGVHADSTVELDVGTRCETFSTHIGLDDEEGENPRWNEGDVVFSVTGDGRVLYRSPVIRPYDDPRPVRLDISGVRYLALIVDDLGNTHNDHADWAGATLRCRVPA